MKRAKFSFFGRSIKHFIGYTLFLLLITVLLGKLFATPILSTGLQKSQQTNTMEQNSNINSQQVQHYENEEELPQSIREEIDKLTSGPMVVITTPQASGEFGAANSMYETAMQYEENGLFTQALIHYKYAFIFYKQKNNAVGKIACLDKIALINIGLENKEQVFDSYNKIIKIAQSIDDKKSVATAVIKIGIARNHFGETQQALKAFEEGLSMSNAISDKEGQAFAFYNLGTTYSQLGEKQKALSYLNQALPLFQAIGNSKRADATVQIIKELS